MNTRSHFHTALSDLKAQVARLATLADRARQEAVGAYLGQDVEAGQRVLDNDTEIDQIARAVDQDCLRLLALEQPVAGDLRRIVGSLRAAQNLERIGDEAANIAKSARAKTGLAGASGEMLRELAAQVERMLAEAVKAFEDENEELALAVIPLDDKADELALAAMGRAIEAMSLSTASPEAAVRAVLAARSLERMGDHAASIAKAVLFILKGTNSVQPDRAA